STCELARGLKSRSKTIARVEVVPWSMARMWVALMRTCTKEGPKAPVNCPRRLSPHEPACGDPSRRRAWQSRCEEALLGDVLLAHKRGDELASRHDFVHAAHALACAPNVFPSLGLDRAVAEIHFAGVACGQVCRIKASGGDGAFEVIARHAGEEIGVDDIA